MSKFLVVKIVYFIRKKWMHKKDETGSILLDIRKFGGFFVREFDFVELL